MRASAKIDIALDRAESGNFGDHKFERDSVWEIRIDYAAGYLSLLIHVANTVCQ